MCLVPGQVGVASRGAEANRRGGKGELDHQLDLLVLRVWQRVSGGQWSVGLVVRNASER